jgi:hypothetical protein
VGTGEVGARRVLERADVARAGYDGAKCRCAPAPSSERARWERCVPVLSQEPRSVRCRGKERSRPSINPQSMESVEREL